MANHLTDHLHKRLFELGQAIDIGQPVYVFDGGKVGPGNDYEEKKHDDERQGSRRPATRSRKGAKGSRWSSSEARDSVSRFWPEWLVNDKLIQLLDSYPGSRVSLDEDGVWLRVRVTPLGRSGPHAI